MSATTVTANAEVAPTTAGPSSGGRLRWAFHDAMVVAKRNLIAMTRIPDQLVFATIQPIMFVLLFAYVFGSAIPLADGGSYKEFLMAGIFGQIAAFASAQTSVAMASDMTKGIVDRFRSLPMARSGVLAGRTIADMANLSFQFVVMSVTGLLDRLEHQQRHPQGRRGLRPAPAVRLLDELDRGVDRTVGEVGRGSQHRRFHLALPAHVPVERLRPHHRHAGVPADRGRVEPHQLGRLRRS